MCHHFVMNCFCTNLIWFILTSLWYLVLINFVFMDKGSRQSLKRPQCSVNLLILFLSFGWEKFSATYILLISFFEFSSSLEYFTKGSAVRRALQVHISFPECASEDCTALWVKSQCVVIISKVFKFKQHTSLTRNMNHPICFGNFLWLAVLLLPAVDCVACIAVSDARPGKINAHTYQ